ncbi:hypothetical protein ACFVXG_26910 [Kitasatospora sp. NPDC058162]|uniref:hypothetical protein n=1 Tax=Kitasatospora sp. NPDC058162 TaxID=3346362 RepID=UPI0036DD114E
MAFASGGSPDQQMDGLEPLPGGNQVVDGEGRKQGEAVGGGWLAGVLVKDLVVEVAQEAPVVPVWTKSLPCDRDRRAKIRVDPARPGQSPHGNTSPAGKADGNALVLTGPLGRLLGG